MSKAKQSKAKQYNKVPVAPYLCTNVVNRMNELADRRKKRVRMLTANKQQIIKINQKWSDFKK